MDLFQPQTRSPLLAEQFTRNFTNDAICAIATDEMIRMGRDVHAGVGSPPHCIDDATHGALIDWQLKQTEASLLYWSGWLARPASLYDARTYPC